MSRIRIPDKVKLVMVLFSSDSAVLYKAEKTLVKKFGGLDYKSDDHDFTETAYYEKEMGKNLKIRIISFCKNVDRSGLAKIKHAAWKVEDKFAVQKNGKSCRTVNIDPGLLSLENFILATGKGYTHRIYLDKGVWADLTLVYKKDGYADLDWTYPSYKNLFVKTALDSIRSIYRNNLKK